MEEEAIVLKIDELNKLFNYTNKIKIICISTTANVNNPSIYFGAIRETETTIAGNIIISDAKYLSMIIPAFDGKVDFFFVDVEEKNNLKNLCGKLTALVAISEIHYYKPNDITVESVDEFIACQCGNLQQKNVLVIGAGNIGSKISLKLSERGATVWLYGPDISRTEKIIDALNQIKRGSGYILQQKSVLQCTILYDIIIGCSPGVPVVEKKHVDLITSEGIIIDVGNGTICADAIAYAKKKGIFVFCASIMPGYSGYIERWDSTVRLLSSMGREKVNEDVSLISVGLIGAYGEVLVSDLGNKNSIIGVCDGKGDILCHEKAKFIINKVKGND